MVRKSWLRILTLLAIPFMIYYFTTEKGCSCSKENSYGGKGTLIKYEERILKDKKKNIYRTLDNIL